MVDDASALPEPSAEGTLAKTPFPHLLVYVHDRQLTGTVVLSDAAGNEAASILFIDGHPMKARTAAPIYLGRVLMELGFLSESALNFSLRKLAEKKILHGQILLTAGSIRHEHLVEGLRVQLVRKLESLVNLPPETTFRYYDGFDALHKYGGDDNPPLDPYPIIWAAVREAPPWEHVSAALDRITAAGLRIADGAQVARFGFQRDEQAVVDLLRTRGCRVHELAGAGKLSPRLTQLLVYCLLITKQVELIRESHLPPPLGSSNAVPDAPPSSKRSLPTEPPVSPNPQAVAKLTLQQQAKAAKARTVVEAKAPSLPWDDRVTPPPMQVVPAGPATPPPQGLRTPLVVPTPGAFVPSRPPTGGAGPSPAVPSAPPRTDPVYTKPTVPSMGAVKGDDSPRPPAADLTADLAARRREILERAEVIDRENYFEMLGVEREATASQVQAAFLTLAKKWHPDRLPAALADVKDQCSRVFSHFSEASQTLRDPQKRETYTLLLREGGATPESQAKIEAVIQAATDFQKAEIFLKRNDLAQAEAHCRKAVEADAERPEYHVLLAWLESQKPSAQAPGKTEELIARLSKAIETNPRAEKPYFYRAMLYKRMNQDMAAARDFRRVIELNPRNIDAQREVRVFEMRKSPAGSKKKDDDDKGGLFGKLFKK